VTEPIRFRCNGAAAEVDAAPGESLLSVLRERLGIVSVKDGCAPQGQCGCCTVLVDGQPRVACVTPAARVEGRAVTAEAADAVAAVLRRVERVVVSQEQAVGVVPSAIGGGRSAYRPHERGWLLFEVENLDAVVARVRDP